MRKTKIKTKEELRNILLSIERKQFINFNKRYNYSMVTDMSWLFAYSDITFEDLVNLDLDTKNVKNMNFMFCSCKKLKKLPLMDTSNVENITSMFRGCSNLESIPKFDFSKVKYMNKFLYDCSYIYSVPNFHLPEVINMDEVIEGCVSLRVKPPFYYNFKPTPVIKRIYKKRVKK